VPSSTQATSGKDVSSDSAMIVRIVRSSAGTSVRNQMTKPSTRIASPITIAKINGERRAENIAQPPLTP
jgi:hypothetical protein